MSSLEKGHVFVWRLEKSIFLIWLQDWYEALGILDTDSFEFEWYSPLSSVMSPSILQRWKHFAMAAHVNAK